MSARSSRNKSGGGNSDNFDGGLKQWLINQNFYMEKNVSAQNTTHLLMTGGKLCIADDQYETFLRYYAEDLERKSATRWWSIHENATRYSRVYFDLDIAEFAEREGAEMHKDDIAKFVRILQTQVLSHFPAVSTHLVGINSKLDHRGVCIVLGAPPAFSQKYNEKSSKTEWRRKTGLHIVFPYLYADLNQLLQLRAASIDTLDRQRDQFQPPDGAASWAAVIDIGVYTGNAGLRMPGSDKFDTCEACRRKRSAMCNVCNGRERVRIERAYTPILSLNATGKATTQWDVLRADPLRMLQLCTIRRPYQYVNDPPFVVPATAAVYADAPIVYMVDTQHILDNLPTSRSSSSRTNSTTDLEALPIVDEQRSRNPGTSWSLAAREHRGYKRTSAAAAINEMTGAKRGQGMSSGARRDFASTRELQQFDGSHYFAEVFQTFLRTCAWPEYSRICVMQVRRCIPMSITGRQRGKKKAEAETMDALRREQQITAEMTSIDDPRPCVYLISVMGEGARYCQNVGREHSTSKIYFYANADGIVQRCFCKKQAPPLQKARGQEEEDDDKDTSLSRPVRSAADNDAIPDEYDDSRPFCSAFSSKPIKWTDHARGFVVLDTFFGYRKHGSIDQPTYNGSLPTIRRPAGSSSAMMSRDALFSTAKLIQMVAHDATTTTDDDNRAAQEEEANEEQQQDAEEKARRFKAEKQKRQLEQMDALMNMQSGSLAVVVANKKNPTTTAPAGGADQAMHIDAEKEGLITTDYLNSLYAKHNRCGDYIPPRAAAVSALSSASSELCVPSLPVATSLAQAEQQALMLMTRNLRGQRQRIEKFTGGLPKRDEIAPELRARLAPPLPAPPPPPPLSFSEQQQHQQRS